MSDRPDLQTLVLRRRVRDRTDRETPLAFSRDVRGFEVRHGLGDDDMRWIAVGPPDQPDAAIALHPPPATPGLSDDEKDALLALVAKGTHFGISLAAPDLDEAFAQIEARGAQILQEPVAPDGGMRDAAFRDPAGNTIRVQETTKEDDRG